MLVERGLRVMNVEVVGDAYGIAGHAIACDFFTDDGKEGVDAFLGKRAPRWKGRQ